NLSLQRTGGGVRYFLLLGPPPPPRRWACCSAGAGGGGDCRGGRGPGYPVGAAGHQPRRPGRQTGSPPPGPGGPLATAGRPGGALRFVERLYAAGAQRVISPASAIQEDEAGPYADALVVFLPPEGPARERVIWMCAVAMGRAMGQQELDPEEYVGTKPVYLWW